MTCNRLGLVANRRVASCLGATSPAFAQTAPSLGSAQSFAVLGGSTVTNTGSSTSSPAISASARGAPSPVFLQELSCMARSTPPDAVARAAQTSLTAAYNDLAGQACTQDLTGQDLGGKTLTAGVYCFSSSAQLTGTLTLDAQGNAERGLHLQDRQHADDGERTRPVVVDQRRVAVQRVLAGRELGDTRHRTTVCREHPRADEHHADTRARPSPDGARAQRRRHARQQYR